MSEPGPTLEDRLESAVADVATRAEKGRRTSAEAAFRARVDERFRAIESDLADLKSRTNGLYLVIASTVLAQVVLKVAP